MYVRWDVEFHDAHILLKGCSSVRTGFISRDDDAQVNYISSKQPSDREVYSMSRQACLRSLTGEVR